MVSLAAIKTRPKRYRYGKGLGVFLVGASALDALLRFLTNEWQEPVFLYYATLSIIGLLLWLFGSYFEHGWEKNPLKPS